MIGLLMVHAVGSELGVEIWRLPNLGQCTQRQSATAHMPAVQQCMHAHIMGFISEHFYGGQLAM